MSHLPSAISRLWFLLLLNACGMSKPARTDAPYDLLLRGGWIVDGSGNPRFAGDVAVNGDRIVATGHWSNIQARDTIEVTGLVVAPGFIDMLGQSETNALIDNRVLSKVTQGITTEVTGEGDSPAPLTDRLVALDSAYLKRYHLDEDWRDLDGYFRRLERTPPTINIATFVGATQVRRAVIGDADRKATPEELSRMEALVDSAMRQGALGISTSLIYAPAIYASTDELIALARVARRYGGIYATHMRNEGADIDAALNETFQIARAANIPVEIWHLKVAGRPNWGRMPHVLARIDSARAAGIDVMADQYSYIASATSLDATIPVWALSGGRDSLLIRLRDPSTRARIREEMAGTAAARRGENMFRGAGGGDGILIASTFEDSLKYLQGKRIGEVARARGRDPVETIFEILLADGSRTGAIYFSMNEQDLQAAMKTWWVAVNTDYGGVAPDGPFSDIRPHPRTYGSFTRILGRYVREQKLMPLEYAVRKMTSLAAQRVGLTERGLLRPGMFADITVFDPATVIDRATFENPHQPSAGIEYVLVNGKVVLRKGQLTNERPGRGLRGPGYRPS
ncbi:MAG TPA: D-aminoacylase [Gemmatimonadales bacterium]|nr:D-aminoacylase [Gemmatimonadales bacterium]